MCDITAGIALASALVGAAGSVQQGKAANASAKYNAKVADMNARISERRAYDSIERGKTEEQAKRREVAQFKGRQEAAMSANGVDVGFGSPLDTLVDTATMGELDALTVRSNAAREAYGHQVEASNKTADANLSRMNGKAAKTGSYFQAAGTLLSGVGDAWGSYKKSSMGAYA
jgi:hypothetical protein